MSFILLNKAAKALENRSQGKSFLKSLAKKRFGKSPQCSAINIVHINYDNYLGFCHKAPSRKCDLLFTRSFLKNMKNHISLAMAKLLRGMADDDFSLGKRLRKQGQMYSILVPGSHQQKVIEYCPLRLQDIGRKAYLLIRIGEAFPWNFHSKTLHDKKAFTRIVSDRRYYYSPIYHKAFMIFTELTQC